MPAKNKKYDAWELENDACIVRRMYNNWAERYEKEFTGAYNYRAPREVFNAVAQSTDICRPDFFALDVGVGTGLLSEQFRQANKKANLSGIDISEDMLSKCRKKGIMNLLKRVNFQTEGLPFADSSFDAVISSGVFELLKRPDYVVEEMARVAKPGGIVAFTSVINWKDEHKNLYGTFKNAVISFLRPREGSAHKRDLLVQALDKGGIALIGEKKFAAYNREMGDTIYKLYVGQKPF